jgi:4-diphosphocytidyl-2-C-methyl-D-erythritol kinase
MIYRSPAKINLSLDVLARRADGYHELQSVAHCIGLCDTLSFDFGVGLGFSLRCNVTELMGDDNLCLKAACAWHDAAQPVLYQRFGGVRITLEKSIPSGAGLGGGSGNAAATLVAMNTFFDDVLSEEQLHAVAAGLGADVPLFLRGGCALMEGVGERLSTLPTQGGAAVVIVPDQHASTPAVYRRFDELGTPSQRSTPALLAAMKQNYAAAATCLGNDLRAAAESLGVDVARPVSLLLRHGALGAQMSGSGAASFGLFATEEEAESAAQKIRDDATLPATYQVFFAPLIAGGIERVAE